MQKNINDWEVLTPNGWSTFTGIKKIQRELFLKICFNDQSYLICTPEHKIKSNFKRFKQAKNYKIGEKVFSNLTIISKEICHKNNDFYDLLNVKQKHQYLTNNVVSHNCAHIDRYKEDEFFNSVMPVISSSKNSKVFLISTAKGTSNRFYKIYSEAELGKNEWKAEKIHWTEVPGRDEKWRKNALSDLGGDEQYFAQEYENVFIETGETAIDKDIIKGFREIVRPPEILNTNEYKVWEAPNPKKIYVFGIDVSDGVGNAASCIQGLDITDLTCIKQVFKYWNKFIDTAHFAKEIFDISKQWGKPPIMIERNSMGGEVVNFLTGQPYNYERIVSYDQSQQVNYQKGGIYSSTNVKYEGVSNMRYWMNSLRAVEIYDLQTIQEIETFVKFPNGTWHKQSGTNIYDDCVMSLLWGLFALHTPITESLFEIVQYDERGKPLKIKKSYYDEDDRHFYGINQSRKNWGDDEFVPVFLGQNTSDPNNNPDMDDLLADNWRVFHNM